MVKTKQSLSSQLTRQPCSGCDRHSAFLDARGLCPFCRGREIETAYDLRPGLFRSLVARIDLAPELRDRRPRAVRRRAMAVWPG